MLLEEVKRLTDGEIVRDYEGNEYTVECVSGTGDGEYLSVWLKMTKFVRPVLAPSIKSDPVYFKAVGDSYVIGVEEPENPEWLSIEDIETLENQREVPQTSHKFTRGDIVRDHLGNEYEVVFAVSENSGIPCALELKMTKFKESVMAPSFETIPLYFDRVGRQFTIGSRGSRKTKWLAIEDIVPVAKDNIPQTFTVGEIVKDRFGNYYEVTGWDAPHWIRLKMRFTNNVVYVSMFNSFDCIGKEYWIGEENTTPSQLAKEHHPDDFITLEHITKVKFGVTRPRSGDLLLDSRGNLTKVIYERGDCTLRVDVVHFSNNWGLVDAETESFTIDIWSDYFKDCVRVGTDAVNDEVEVFTEGEIPGNITAGEITRETEFTAESCAKRAEAKALKDIEVLIEQAVQEGKFQVVRNDAPRLKSLLEAKGFEIVGNVIRW